MKREAPKKTLATARNALATAEAARLTKERLLGDAQLKLKVEEERLQKLEKQFLTLSSGREYKTMEHQIKGKKADKSLIEDEILHLMEDAETARKAAADAKDAVDKAEATAVSVEESVQAATREGRERLATLDREAAVAEKACDPEVLSAYQTLLGRRNGLAIAPIVEPDLPGLLHEHHRARGEQAPRRPAPDLRQLSAVHVSAVAAVGFLKCAAPASARELDVARTAGLLACSGRFPDCMVRGDVPSDAGQEACGPRARQSRSEPTRSRRSSTHRAFRERFLLPPPPAFRERAMRSRIWAAIFL